MVRAIYKTIFAMLAAIAFSSTEANLGVAYSPFQPGKEVTRENLLAEFKLLALNFSTVRTFHVVVNGLNLIDIAAEVGIQIDVGVHMTDEKNTVAEIDAVCVAYKSYSKTIRTVYVGNENLLHNDFGKFSAEVIIKYIKQVQGCVGGDVRVGTVQRINEWLWASGAEEIVKVSTAAGVNIYPFLAPSTLSPIKMLQAQWDQIAIKYRSMEMWTVTETGWPTAGGSLNDSIASPEIAQQYLNDVTLWSVDTNVIWFMLCDSLVSYNGMETEKHFGLYDATCTIKKLELPVKQISSNSGNKTSGVPLVTSVDQPLELNGTGNSAGKPMEQNAEHKGQVPNPGKPLGTTGKDCPI